MWQLLRVCLHALPPETAHAAATQALRYVPRMYRAERLGQELPLMGLRFPNRIGLAAGFDKNGDHLQSLAKLGFGCIEIGTVTPKPQAGSPAPRLFRLSAVRGLINRMGFNSLGVRHVTRQLAKQRGAFQGVLGCNIGCNRDTPAHEAAQDYLTCLRELYAVADYFTVNVSSPNTPQLKQLHQAAQLSSLLAKLADLREQLCVNHKHYTPLLLKISPDLDESSIEQIAQVVQECGIEGVIATNTTAERSAEIAALPFGGQPGGVSGAPLRDRSDRALKLWRSCLPQKTVLVGVGGIASKQDAQRKLALGADLLQLYTGLIYQGPGLIAECAAAAWEHERAA